METRTIKSRHTKTSRVARNFLVLTTVSLVWLMVFLAINEEWVSFTYFFRNTPGIKMLTILFGGISYKASAFFLIFHKETEVNAYFSNTIKGFLILTNSLLILLIIRYSLIPTPEILQGTVLLSLMTYGVYLLIKDGKD